MQHLETLIQAIPPAVFAVGGATASNAAQSTSEAGGSPIAPFMYPTNFPSGVPPPSLHVFPLMNPSTHFTHDPAHDDRQCSPGASFGSLLSAPISNKYNAPADALAEETSRMSLAASYLYFDDEGYTRWQGETSGLPVLDILLEKHAPSTNRETVESPVQNSSTSPSLGGPSTASTDWFPNRTPRKSCDVNPQILWRLITTQIVPELMDR